MVDEATANVDPETDKIIQKIIRSEFSHCTTLIIAHRLNTIVDSNKIIGNNNSNEYRVALEFYSVLDSGEIKEFDSPSRLLSDRNSLFHKMASETSIFNELVQKAK